MTESQPLQVFPRHRGDEDLEGFVAGLAEDRPVAIGLEGDRWDAAACTTLAAMLPSLRLDSLSLRGTMIGDRGVAILAAIPGLAAVRSLAFERCGLTDTGVEILVGAARFERLTKLYLCNRDGVATGIPNRIGDAGAFALASTRNLPAIDDIDLWNTEIGDAGFEAIAASESLPMLDSVYAWGTRLTAAGAARIKALAAERSHARDAAGIRPFRWTAYHTAWDERTTTWTDEPW